MQAFDGFIQALKKYPITTQYIVIKPNWANNNPGEYTEPEILDALLSILPESTKKIVVESYTPWRGLTYPTSKGDELKTDLDGGKNYWNFYKQMDQYFLSSTGIDKVLQKHQAKYLNITNEYWGGNTVEYVPQQLLEIKNKATFISLAKIKLEEGFPQIIVSLSLKNLFGLLPHPSRSSFHSSIPQTISDLYHTYSELFPKSLWINEGIKTMVKNYCQENQKIEKDQNLFFISENAIEVDSEVCQYFNIDPNNVPYMKVFSK